MEKDNFIKKHVDTVIIIGAIVSSVLWMNGKFNGVDERFNGLIERLHAIENRVTKIETILIVKNIYPAEIAANKEQHAVRD